MRIEPAYPASQNPMLTSGDLLATKLETPVLRKTFVHRVRLTDQFRNIQLPHVTLLVASAGYGKTTLLGEWLSTTKSKRTAWVSLSAYDNDTLRFWAYIVAALNKANPELQFDAHKILYSQCESVSCPQLNSLLNAISQIPEPACLVLDDYHTIVEESIHQGLVYFIGNMPSNLHLVISSRTTPPIPFSRLRSQRRLTEITERDLSFTLSETDAFLSLVMELEIDHEGVTTLHDLTEGWAVGLQLTALSLQEQRDQKGFIANFSTSHRHILEYMTEEVLRHLDERKIDFLLKTSFLNELSAPLCDAILERNDSYEMLRELEQAKLFIIPINERQSWYRYHALFSETLQYTLIQKYPGLLRNLQHKTCQWLWENGFPEIAVPYALEAEDYQLAAEIVDQCAMQALIEFDLTSLVMWINRFSEELILQRPRLGIFYALANYNLGRLDLIEPKLQVVEQALKRAEEGTPAQQENSSVTLEIESIRAAIACLRNDYLEGIVRAEKIIENLPIGDNFFYGFLNHYIAYAYESAWDLDSAAKAFLRGSHFALQHNYPMEHIYSQCELARIRKEQGLLTQSIEIYKKALDFALLAGVNIGWVVHPQTGIADIYLEWNNLTEAEYWMKEAINSFELVDVSTYNWVFKVSLCSRFARYKLATGEIDAAAYYLEKLQSSLDSYQLFSQLFGDAIDVQVRLWLARGEWRKARRWLIERLEPEKKKKTLTVAEKMAAARLLMTSRKGLEALTILNALEEKARQAGGIERLLEVLCLKAMVIFNQNESDPSSLEIIDQAMSVGASSGYIRVFIDEGQRMNDLLQEYSKRHLHAKLVVGDQARREYLHEILTAFEKNDPCLSFSPIGSPQADSTGQEKQYKLSNREQQVIQLLARGYSTKEVSQELVISINTAKTHIKNIYQAMDVHTRFDMVQRAKECGLLS